MLKARDLKMNIIRTLTLNRNRMSNVRQKQCSLSSWQILRVLTKIMHERAYVHSFIRWQSRKRGHINSFTSEGCRSQRNLLRIRGQFKLLEGQGGVFYMSTCGMFQEAGTAKAKEQKNVQA